MKSRALVAVVCLVSLTACTDDPAPEAAAPACTEPAPVSATGEVVGSSSDGTSLHALLMGDPGVRPDGSVPVDMELKIVVRMTGAGDLAVEADGPDRLHTTPTWGPEGHGGSTFQRPGAEWGVGFVFPSPGCWLVRFERADEGSAVLPLLVS